MPRYSHHHKKAPGSLISLLRAGGAAVLAVFALLLIFTLFLYLGWLPENSIPALTGICKVVGAAVAGILAAKYFSEHLWRSGALAALLFLMISALVMSLFTRSFAFSIALLGDALLCAVVGAAVAYALRLLIDRRKSA
ncbi:MAG: TIGR04086 family membrane protein [Clostridiales bacterium]|nr:TIGR04086 family membrane protein [Clostridiales bacterium]